MAVLAIFIGAISRSQYDTLRFTVDWRSDQPAGAILHAAAFDDAGRLHVADVWDSAAALDAFVSERLAPALRSLGIPAPEVAIYPLHILQAYDTITKYRI
jgi:hypothetical protein